MWPRPDGRGNKLDALKMSTAALLQCGRALTDAEISPMGLWAWFWRRASMWPRPDGRGNAGSRVGDLDGEPASMWPRPDGRGNSFQIAVTPSRLLLQCGRALTDAEIICNHPDRKLIDTASMWPRPDGRGNPCWSITVILALPLQCGRALTDAEI